MAQESIDKTRMLRGNHQFMVITGQFDTLPQRKLKKGDFVVHRSDHRLLEVKSVCETDSGVDKILAGFKDDEDRMSYFGSEKDFRHAEAVINAYLKNRTGDDISAFVHGDRLSFVTK